jgi:signal peptidase I
MYPQEVGATEWLANLSVGAIVAAAFALTLLRLLLVPFRSAFARSVAEMAESLIIAGVLVFLVIRPFLVQAFYIPSESMEPTLGGHDQGTSRTGENYSDTIHDHIFVNRLGSRLGDPHRGDILVFRREPNATPLIKRLIGLPGDTIEVKSDGDGTVRVFRNGEPLVEPYIKEPMQLTPEASYAVHGPVKLSTNELFMMGDNRNHSLDSRFWGPLPRDHVIGRAMLTFWPLNRLHWLR